MTKELSVAAEDLAELAHKAEPLAPIASDVTADDAAKLNEELARGLDHLRGEAVQRAKAANVRLRWQAVGVTVVSFGIGIVLGSLISCRRSSAV